MDVDAGIEKIVRKGLKDPRYLRQLLNAYEENYQDALKDGDGVRVEMFMAGLIFVRDTLDGLGYPGWRASR
jgi:hypothetical protein